MDFAAAFFNEALWSPNHKTCSALGCIQNLHFPIHFCPFSPVPPQPHQNSQAWCKCCVHLRAKLKHVLWLGDLKASLKNAAAKSFHKTSSIITYCWVSYPNWLIVFNEGCKIWFNGNSLLSQRIVPKPAIFRSIL